MNFTATIIGQMIAFAVFVWFCMKYVWPPITKAMQDREQRIADGLIASDEAEKQLQQAEHDSQQILNTAKDQASTIIEQANRRSAQVIEEAKGQAVKEGVRLIESAQADIETQISQAREQLRHEVAQLSIAGASKILEREIDAKAHRKMLDQAATQL